ncbi:MAG: CapA family protein [Lachnospiraceae bacterium]|nr:CapA family protein [Lachnospiraceae bacterium]
MKMKRRIVSAVMVACFTAMVIVGLPACSKAETVKEDEKKQEEVKAPEAVTNLKTKILSASKVKVTWDSVKDAKGYMIYKKTGDSDYKEQKSTTATSYTTGIKGDVAYKFKVIPFSKEGEKKVKGASTVTSYELHQIKISAAGDCTLGVDSRYNSRFNEMYQRVNDPAYFLKKVKKVFEKDDITVVNLEGTLTTSTNRADKTFTFKGPKKYTKILTSSSVELVNLANNHTRDFGEQGLKDTKDALKKADIKYFIGSNAAYKKVDGVKVGFLGFNMLRGVSKSTVKNQIAKVKKKGAKVVIVTFHGGVEHTHNITAQQKEYYRYAVDQGANLVLAHHPHVLQGIEKYNGSMIVYSLGNFCFGGNSNPSDKDTMIYQEDFLVDSNGVFVKGTNRKVLPCSLSGHKNYNDFQPKLLTGSEKRRVIRKLQRISRGMKGTIKDDGTIK